MSIEAHLYSTLSANVALIAEVPASRIYYGEAEQGAEMPYIVSRQLGRESYNVLSGKPSLDRFRVQVTAYAKTPAKARTIGDLMLDAIESTGNGAMQFERSTKDPLSGDYGIQQEFYIHLNRGS